ncbi:MAG: hypothetical protein Solivirus4_10 [Solivirus sp.]|uniref:Protein kinase domain-containing protein n=1 Tax=Solivirus sp. TaxID=2487772 RepID=A0A3G5AJZ1_9VIRU|nr:MAG: hypothetical protein Solivirus4_10 [Solivirus sp.]
MSESEYKKLVETNMSDFVKFYNGSWERLYNAVLNVKNAELSRLIKENRILELKIANEIEPLTEDEADFAAEERQFEVLKYLKSINIFISAEFEKEIMEHDPELLLFLETNHLFRDSASHFNLAFGYSLDLSCLKQAGYRIDRKIEGGSIGLIYITCTTDNKCNTVIKVDLEANERTLNSEIEATVLAGEVGLGPKVIQVLKCPLIRNSTNEVARMIKVMIIERLDATYEDLRKNPEIKSLVDSGLTEILERYLMSETNLVQGDLHTENIMFKIENGTYTPYIIDWSEIRTDRKYVLEQRLIDVDRYHRFLKSFIKEDFVPYLIANGYYDEELNFWIERILQK